MLLARNMTSIPAQADPGLRWLIQQMLQRGCLSRCSGSGTPCLTILGRKKGKVIAKDQMERLHQHHSFTRAPLLCPETHECHTSPKPRGFPSLEPDRLLQLCCKRGSQAGNMIPGSHPWLSHLTWLPQGTQTQRQPSF